ncbi:MAG: class I SAM-dependent methyltransferase [Bdellovibrionales bacterium]|nr:class I SAM-dependent methyltransferase [Bdellovibrionales bacterium]
MLEERGNISLSIDYLSGLSLPANSAILDIGTNHGSLVAELLARGYAGALGVEPCLGALREGLRSAPKLSSRLVASSGELLPFKDRSFEVITCFDVLEHVRAPKKMLAEVRRILKPNGMFVFQTPNLFTNVPWEVFKGRSLTAWKRYHCSLQTLWTLRSLLEGSGFSEIKIEKRSIRSQYNLIRLREHIGPAAPVMLAALEKLPLALATNFWGHARSGAAQPYVTT